MKIRKITLIAGTIFYTSMLVLSFIAKRIHIATLPKVTFQSLVSEKFEDREVSDAMSEGNNEQEVMTDNKSVVTVEPIQYIWNLAIPKELYDNQKVYIIVKEVINGEERDIAKEVTNLETGQSNDYSYEVISGLSPFDQVITTGQDMIQDGCEVYVEN